MERIMGMVKIGIIGTGGMSRVHGNQLKELETVKIEAITDPNQEQRDLFASRFDVEPTKTYSDHHTMLEKAELDGVIICSPHTLHFQHAQDAIKADCHVLLEKPMVCSSKQCRSLIELANRHNKHLQVSYQRHFQPEFLYIKEAIQSGVIGNLTSVNASLYQEWKQGTVNTWRQNPSLSGGGMLMDSGSHIIDVLLWITGQNPVELHSYVEKRDSTVEINSVTTMRFPNGLIGSLNIIGDSPCWHETYIFSGEDGAIFYDNGKVTIRKLGQEPITPTLPKQTTNPDKSFIDCIIGLKAPYVKGNYALRVIELTERIYKSGNYKPIN
jgi:predicted dehydrogenase